jgi:hypothetical protein
VFIYVYLNWVSFFNYNKDHSRNIHYVFCITCVVICPSGSYNKYISLQCLNSPLCPWDPITLCRNWRIALASRQTACMPCLHSSPSRSFIAISHIISSVHPECCRYVRLCGLVVRVPGYITGLYCASCEVRTDWIYVM